MNRPLYCYRLNEMTRQLECYVINEYTVVSLGAFTDKKEIRFDARLTGFKTKAVYYLKSENIDRFVRGCLFTYESDSTRAYEIIKHSLKTQIELATEKLKKLQNIYDTLN